MMKFLGWVLVIFALFCVFGFIVDWVELHKQNAPGQANFCLSINHGKIHDDVSGVVNTVEGWFRK